jgi:hypothetical protein
MHIVLYTPYSTSSPPYTADCTYPHTYACTYVGGERSVSRGGQTRLEQQRAQPEQTILPSVEQRRCIRSSVLIPGWPLSVGRDTVLLWQGILRSLRGHVARICGYLPYVPQPAPLWDQPFMCAEQARMET